MNTKKRLKQVSKQANYQYSETKEALVITTHHKLALRAWPNGTLAPILVKPHKPISSLYRSSIARGFKIVDRSIMQLKYTKSNKPGK